LQFALDEAVVPGVVEDAVVLMLIPSTGRLREAVMLMLLLLNVIPYEKAAGEVRLLVAAAVEDSETLLVVPSAVDRVLDPADRDNVTLPEIATPELAFAVGFEDVDSGIGKIEVDDGMELLDALLEGVAGVATPMS
jgi:hypothetical protein